MVQPSFSKPPGQRPVWQFLLPPMLLVSLGLHGLVLFTPVAPSEEDLVPPPDPAEEDGIALTKIEPPQSRTAPPKSTTGTVKTATNTASVAGAAAGAGRAASRGGGSGSGQRDSSRQNNDRRDRGRRTQRDRPPAVSNDVPNLPATDPVNVPEVPAPPVTPSPAEQNAKALEDYLEVVGKYRGQSITKAQAETFRDEWLRSFTEAETADDPTDAATPQYPDLEITPFNDIDPLPYEVGVCLPHAPATYQSLVLVKADGTLDEYTRLLQSTGYANFDDAANRKVRSYDYPDVDEPRAYLVDIAVDYDAEACRKPQEIAELPDSYFTLLESYEPTLTSPAEFTAARTAWLTTVTETDGLSFPEDKEELETALTLDTFDQEAPYRLNVCLPIQPKTARWGIVVNPDGTVKGEPEPLQSTGYQIFDTRTKARVEAFDFPTSETAQAFVVEVPVDYNDLTCTEPMEYEKAVAASTAAAETATAVTAGEDTPGDTAAATPESDPAAQESPPTTDLDLARQEELLTQGREALLESQFGSVNADNPSLVVSFTESGWPEDLDQSCFLSALNPDTGLVPAETGADAFFLTQNLDFVPETLAEVYGLEPTQVDHYCDAPLYTLNEAGIPYLFASVIGLGEGGSSSVVVVWEANPSEP